MPFVKQSGLMARLVAGSLPLIQVTGCEENTGGQPLKSSGVDAQDMNELRRMTCPEGQLYENCPNLKALATACRNQQHGLFRSALDIHSAQRRHSDDGADGRGRAYWLRLAKNHLVGGYHQLRQRLSPMSRSEVDILGEGRRHLIVEFLSHENNNNKRKCKSFDDVSCVVSRGGDLTKEPNRNMSSCMVIHSLKDGRLTAEISLTLEDCLEEEDIVVRVQNYTLEILTQKRGKKGNGKGKDAQNVERTKCGQIDIPIYLDPGTLWFDLVDNNTLLMEGDTKTALPRPKFHSQEELNSTNSKSTSPRSRSPFERRQSNATWYINNTQPADRPCIFRQRSYTQ